MIDGRQDELRKQQAASALEYKLEARPDRDELLGRNILRAGGVAPSLLQAQEELRQQMIQQNLEAALER
jgi:hypothetical protein